MKPLRLPLKRGHDLFYRSRTETWPGGACRCSSRSPAVLHLVQALVSVQLQSPQPSAALSAAPTPLWQAAILYMKICLSLPPPTSKFCRGGWGHQWSLWTRLHNNLLKDGISISDSARHSPAPLSKLVRARGPEAKLIVHKLIQPPRFCLFKWDS